MLEDVSEALEPEHVIDAGSKSLSSDLWVGRLRAQGSGKGRVALGAGSVRTACGQGCAA
jgi:hypothetical protein